MNGPIPAARSLVRRIEDGLGTPRAGLCLALLLCLVYTVAYLGFPELPGNHRTFPANAWWGWWDQGQYLKATQALATLHLSRETYWYPPGYSLLAVPFWYAAPKHAYFIPDLLLVLGSGIVLWRLAGLWISRMETLLLGALFIGSHGWTLSHSLIIPWTTIPSQFIYLTACWILLTKNSVRSSLVLSCLAAVLLWFRPVDAFALAPMLVASVLLLRGLRTRIAAAFPGVAVIALSFGGICLLNKAICGSWQSDYDRNSYGIGFFSYPLILKFHWIFVDPGAFFGEVQSGLLCRFPWLMLGGAGAAFLVRTKGWPAVAVLGTIALSWSASLAYNDFLPTNIFRFHLIHYIAWALPLLFLFSYAAVTRGLPSLFGFSAIAASLVLSFALLSMGLSYRALPIRRTGAGRWKLPPDRPLVVWIHGTSNRNNMPTLALDGRRLIPAHDYLASYATEDVRIFLPARTAGRILDLLSLDPGADASATAAVPGWSLVRPTRRFFLRIPDSR